MVDSICKELILRSNELENLKVETIYFGGGTPSLLNKKELEKIFETIYENYSVNNNLESTIETNPEDLDKEKLKEYTALPINRLSIGIQSFFNEDLKFMNRAHSGKRAEEALTLSKEFGFKNITADLIYGVPTLSNNNWEENLNRLIKFEIPHISAYALTVEPKTILQHQILNGKVADIDENKQFQQFKILQEVCESNAYDQYEISNFGKPNFYSKHNSSYWKGKPYLGIGPSAHSYNGNKRSWNVANNAKYIKVLEQNKLDSTEEILNESDRFNELIMIGLRTIWGVDLNSIKSNFPISYYHHLMDIANSYVNEGKLEIDEKSLKLAKNARFLADGIASDLFIVQ